MGNISETLVTYHRGALDGSGKVLSVHPAPTGDSFRAVVTDVTPFHPVDHSWPDQPADHGMISVGSTTLPVVDTQILSMEKKTGAVRIGAESSARRGDTGHVFAVAHIVAAREVDVASWIGGTAQLEVDAARRLALSAAHTGCHLVAYAFNEAVEGLWTKNARRDSRGNRNFDAAALLETRHHTGGSVDRYRLGKSLRKKGFIHPELIADLDSYVLRANTILASWVASKAEVTLTGESDTFTAERMWRCTVSPPAAMPCGGTHVSDLGEIASINISADFSEDTKELALRASTQPR